MFDNRFTLHPHRLESLAAEEGESYLAYLERPEEERAEAHGRSLALAGVGDRTLAELPTELGRFCEETLSDMALTRVDAAVETTRSYCSSLILGYLKEREEQILQEQEELRQALAKALEAQSEELLFKNHAVDTTTSGIVLADMSGIVTYVNAAFLALWGYDGKSEVVGRRVNEFLNGGAVNGELASPARVDGWHGELSARRKDGSTFDVALSTSLVRDQDDVSIGIMASFVDVTVNKRLEAQVQQIQRLDALGQISGGIVHDFNNLLMAVSGRLQLLLTEAEPGTLLRQELLQLRETVDRGAGFTKQLRYFTRLQSGERRPINLNEVAAETYELLKRTFPLEIIFDLSLSATPWTVEADATQMSQVLVNLCVNGRNAILERAALDPGRAVNGRLSISTENVILGERQAQKFVSATPGRYLRLVVSDTGVGMSSELLSRIFIPFVSGGTVGGGGGLGLPVVQGIVRGHHGFIDVESTPGVGTTFSVYLPVAESHESVPVRARDLDSPSRAASGTILVVDDDDLVRDVLVRKLQQSGYKVLSAASGMDALALFEERHDEIELVVLDMVMPQMGGRETLQRLKSLSPEVAVIVVTGFVEEALARDLAKSGADGLVEKPLDLDTFAAKVRELIGDPLAKTLRQ